MKKNRYARMTLALAGAVVICASCSNNKYKSMTEINDSAEAASTEQVAPLTEVKSSLDSTVMEKYNAAFFENEANKSDKASADKWAETSSGLRYAIVKEGKGNNPTAESEVTVHYIGELTDGKVFDSSISRGEPTSFPLNRVIPGWTEGLQLMKPGGLAVFYIPGKLAYGEQGQPAAGIGPDATLIFGVELLSVQ
ncbi:MAG: FKBP-type peptidyl-prolyl cis-trans isomerase [Prevotella sp.]|nr:FKBP-type peptidyl-prolyl cis-trans isomerase [Bacteroides sp.]MCM1366499.1 FKBP-type peptidyl-prolyl cis-trans isomerase [Prevotella sp.]MCM1436838.1 FKBP-type peptidyl-prolyl cis-trans isomerase [Prevotella sp.]